MKNSPCSTPWAVRLATAALVGATAGSTSALADLVIDSFDAADSTTPWTATWGTSPTLTWNSQNASGGAAGSGCLQVTADYFTAADDGWEQMVITRTFESPVVGSQYLSISADIKVDPSSIPNLTGQYGYFEFKRPDGSAMGGVNLTTTNWSTVKFDLAPTEGSLSGLIIQNGNGTFQGPVTYLLDNLKFNAPPAPKTVVDSLDDETAASLWSATWGSSPVLSWDPQNSSGGAAGSGSLKVAADYFTAADDGWEQMVITHSFETPIVGSEYVAISVDIKVDPTSTPNLTGQYGYFELKRTDGSAIGGVNLTSTNWATISFALAPTEGTLSGIIVQNGNSAFQGPVTYYLDNLVFTKAAAGPDAPKLTLTPNTNPGLKLYASAPGQAYQRQNVLYAPSEELGNGLWWVNQPDPVTYSITWADFPSASTYAGFQGHIILPTDTGGAVTPDWNDANVILVEFQYANTAGPDGQNGTADDVVMARARFLHKVNEPGANGMLYRTKENAASGPVGVLGEILAPSMIGTWSVTFQGNTTVILTAPDQSKVTLTMPAEDAALYEPTAKGVSALFGVQPNSDTRVGLSAVVSRIKITKGSTVVVDDTFQTAELDPAKWTVRAQDPGGVFPLSTDLAYLVSWPLPDTGFGLERSPAVSGPWTAIGTPQLVGARRVVQVKQADLPSATAGFFRLVKPAGQ